MRTFEVWAPYARAIEVKVGGERFPLERGQRGWWSVDVKTAGAGTEYLFLLNDEEPGVPDPRSRWQPTGVHGASRIVDPTAFAWTDEAWRPPPLTSAVLYELHVGTFTAEGTFAAAESRLEYLKDLGITHLELMPVGAFPGNRGWGYDGVDLYAPHGAYGEPAALQHFVNACHGSGVAVLLDVVYNHFGPVGNYLAKFGPYLTAAHTTPWGDAINLEEAGSNEVRRFLIDNALMWLSDYHFDGLRLDAVHAFIDRSAIPFLEQLPGEVRLLESRLKKNFVLIAESDLNDPRLVIPTEAGGFGFDAQWSDDFHHALFTVLTGESQGYYADFGSLADLAKSIEEVYVYSGNYSRFRRRDHGRPAAGLPRHRFLGYAQNHDQVGNRAKGERLSRLVSLGRAKIAAALVLTSPFVPLLFQGEEFAASAPFQYFTGYEDPKIGRLVSEGRKKDFAYFGWNPDEVPDPQDEETFERSKLDWAELCRPPHRDLFAWYKDLIRLRRSLSDLQDDRPGATKVQFDEERKWLMVRRGQLRVACNLGKDRVFLDTDPETEPETGPETELLLASDSSVCLHPGRIELGPDSIAIFRPRQGGGEGHPPG